MLLVEDKKAQKHELRLDVIKEETIRLREELSRQLMALEELRFVREHEQEFGRIAIVAPEGWLNLAAHIAGLLSHTDSEYFDTPEDALAWLNAN